MYKVIVCPGRDEEQRALETMHPSAHTGKIGEVDLIYSSLSGKSEKTAETDLWQA